MMRSSYVSTQFTKFFHLNLFNQTGETFMGISIKNLYLKKPPTSTHIPISKIRLNYQLIALVASTISSTLSFPSLR